MKNGNLEKYLFHDQYNKDTGIAISERFITNHNALHWHDFLELELILSGCGEQILNGQQTQLKKGCLSVIRLTDFHQVTPKDELHLLNLMVDDKLLSQEMLSKITTEDILFFDLKEEEAKAFEMLFRLCLAENESVTPDTSYLKHLVICIFLKILKLAPDGKGKSFSNGQPIQTALLYMHTHFRENPTLNEVAKIVHYNASHFSSTFHKEMGTTYCDYLNKLKISYAKELLLCTNLKISDICIECGFTSHSNFLRIFKEHLRVSPMQFRKQANEKPNLFEVNPKV